MNYQIFRKIGMFILFFIWEITLIFSDRGSNNKDIFYSDIEILPASLNNDLSSIKEMEETDTIISAFIRKWNITGASLAIVKEGRLIYAKGLGYTNKETKEIVQPYHQFRIASVSKLITAVTIMKLIEDNKLKFDDKVFGKRGILNDSIYSQIVDPRVYDITIHHLLNHSAGWHRHWGDYMFMSLFIGRKMKVDTSVNIKTVIQYALSKKLHFKPGKRSSYCNLGYGILGEVIEKVTKMSYEDYVTLNILNPLGIYDMQLGKTLYEEKAENEVRYYEQPGSKNIFSCFGTGEYLSKSYGGNHMEVLSSAGGWIATPAALMKFLVAIDGYESKIDILSPESIKMMTKAPKPGFKPLGWNGTYVKGTWWRTGTLAGTSALLMRQPNEISWVVLTNTSTWNGSQLSREIRKTMQKVIQSMEVWPTHDLFNDYELKPVSNFLYYNP